MTDYMDFFPNIRKKIQLDDYKPLLDENGAQRFKLVLLMPLTGTPDTDIPFWVRPSYERMDVAESPVIETDLRAELEGFTLEAFSTDKAQFPIETEAHGLAVTQEELGRRHLLLPGSTLRDFKLVRKNLDGNSFVCLKFTVTTKADAALALWLHKYHGAQCWFSFDKPVVDPSLAAAANAGAQMTLSEAVQSEPSTEESQSNVANFFAGADPTAVEDAPKPELAGDGVPVLDEVRKAACESAPLVEESFVDEHGNDVTAKVTEMKQRRPRGFAGPMNKSVN